jgi:hypothetical protein
VRRTRLLVLAGGAVAALAFAGLTAAQDGTAPAQPTAPGSAAIALPSDAAPPEETAPTAPAPLNQTVEVEPEPAPPAAPPAPQKRPRFTAAVLQAVDKVTAETLRFEAKVGEPVRYKGLVLTVHACESTAPQEGYADSLAHLEIQSEPEQISSRAASRVVYRGWMSSGSPGLHPFEHSVYDVWLIACRTAAPPA